MWKLYPWILVLFAAAQLQAAANLSPARAHARGRSGVAARRNVRSPESRSLAARRQSVAPRIVRKRMGAKSWPAPARGVEKSKGVAGGKTKARTRGTASPRNTSSTKSRRDLRGQAGLRRHSAGTHSTGRRLRPTYARTPL